MCDYVRREKAEFTKALDTYISAKIHEGIKDYHFKKGKYEWLTNDKTSKTCPCCGHTKQEKKNEAD